MTINLDKALGIHPQALALRAHRAEVLAANMANADTPNYKAKDIDFKAALNQARDQSSSDAAVLMRTHAAHLPTGFDGSSDSVMYRVPDQSSLDGNTVDDQVEQAEFARNAIQYQASLSFLNGKIKALMTAIRGD